MSCLRFEVKGRVCMVTFTLKQSHWTLLDLVSKRFLLNKEMMMFIQLVELIPFYNFVFMASFRK